MGLEQRLKRLEERARAFGPDGVIAYFIGIRRRWSKDPINAWASFNGRVSRRMKGESDEAFRERLILEGMDESPGAALIFCAHDDEDGSAID